MLCCKDSQPSPPQERIGPLHDEPRLPQPKPSRTTTQRSGGGFHLFFLGLLQMAAVVYAHLFLFVILNKCCFSTNFNTYFAILNLF